VTRYSSVLTFYQNEVEYKVLNSPPFIKEGLFHEKSNTVMLQERSDHMLFQKGELSIRYVTEDDVQTLSNWLSNPEVLRFYEGRDKPQSPE
jgi:hypothetical protein